MLGSGVLAGFPVVDLKVTLIDGASHDVEFIGDGLRNRRAHGVARGAAEGRPVLLEPIMKVEVVTPEDYTGSVIGDLNSRRGQIHGQDMRGNANVVNAMVPLANMFGYRQQPAFHVAGARHLHHAVRSLRASPLGGRRGDPGEVRLTRTHIKRTNGESDGQREIRPH